MADTNENTKVAVEFKDFPELLEAMDQMVVDDDTDRSKFIRKLIRQEQSRRHQLELPLPTKQPKKSRQERAAIAA
jgi:metal-responsive CopG/Arc/MetJ family transcriptional regulator